MCWSSAFIYFIGQYIEQILSFFFKVYSILMIQLLVTLAIVALFTFWWASDESRFFFPVSSHVELYKPRMVAHLPEPLSYSDPVKDYIQTNPGWYWAS